MAFSQVASAATSTLLLSADSTREQVFITNTDANALNVMLDSQAASSTAYSARLLTNDTLETDYRGEIRGIWDGDGSGHANITVY